MLRQRKNAISSSLDKVKHLDAFPKLQDEYVESTRLGGGMSILSRIIIVVLIYVEVNYYLDRKLMFTFQPDIDVNAKLKINIDLTIAMPCGTIGADILDSTNQNVFSFGALEEEDTWFELSPNQKMYFEYIQNLNSYLREEYHSIADVMYKGDGGETMYSFPQREVSPNRPHDACRIHGSLTLNKVSGNFHVTAGRSLQFPQGHIHLNIIFNDPMSSNFSHRINRFSFGQHTSGIVHPLEGEEKIFQDPRSMIQYSLEVVPTEIHISTLAPEIKTFQYSVKENVRVINHDSGSHGIPGVYFKYDMSALMVKVHLKRANIIKFGTRLCSVIAGIVVIASFMNAMCEGVFRFLMKKFAPQLLHQFEETRKLNLNV